MDVITCPECNSELRAGYGLVECKQCLTKFFRSANGVRPITAVVRHKRSNRVLEPIPVAASDVRERCGICGSDQIIGTGRVQGYKGFRSRRSLCAGCSTLRGTTLDIAGEWIQTVVMDTPTSRTMMQPGKFASRDENRMWAETRNMVIPPFVGD